MGMVIRWRGRRGTFTRFTRFGEAFTKRREVIAQIGGSEKSRKRIPSPQPSP
jgi:hypothetical protein